MKTAEEILKCARYYPFTRGQSNALLFASAVGYTADDVIQEYALRCLEKPEEIEINPYWTARHIARKIRKLGYTLDREGKIKNARHPQPAGELFADVFDKTQSPEEVFKYKELRAKVEKFIDDFWTPKTNSFKYVHYKRNRMITRLYVFDGWKQVEISGYCGLFVSQTNAIILKCIEPMREELANYKPQMKANKEYYSRLRYLRHSNKKRWEKTLAREASERD